MRPVHEDIGDLLANTEEDRFSCPKAARKKAMDFLARRDYGQTELIDKLKLKGFDPDTAERAVMRLTEEGLQSDRRFAENFVQSRVNQGKGPVRIRMDLARRGLGDADIERAIDEAGSNWIELARDIRQKKFGQQRPTDFKSKARQMRFLQYRGFEPDHIRRAVGTDDD